ncbi:putative transcription factor WD40-like family [Helianthus annuus]|nr:putative transcription factor WD40-like family [Helianthus annuus]KAJ0938141.1 putative transcription factor WD40-like family [Helianthus annuus]KAJ0946039.1 putative transcription factor WD40-like family [Helianthus annuus]
MDVEKDELASSSNRVNKGSLKKVNIGIKDVDAMLEQACLDRDKDLDDLMSPYGDQSNNIYQFNNGTLDFDPSNYSPRILEHPRSPFFTQQSSFFTSSPRPKPKPVSQEDMNAEILRLVDSAIMGQSESMDTMKNIVSGAENFVDGVDAENIADLLVDTLLTTMGGVESFEEEDDSNTIPTVMKNTQAAIISGELLPWLPWLTDSVGFMSPRTRMVRGLRTILRACTRNRAMCCSAGLTRVLLQTAEKIFLDDVGSSKQLKWNGSPLCSCLQYLAGHSVTVADLSTWFRLVKSMIKTPWGPRLMVSLEKALSGKESRGPQASFEFDGESSGLLGPGEGRWPFPKGYAFATWMLIESFGAPEAESNQGIDEGARNLPCIFSFISSDNQGIEAYFHAQSLVVESGSGKGPKVPVYFTHAFKSQCWYFIALEHTLDGEIRLYIDGKLHESRSLDLPRITKPLSFFCIGTNAPPTMACLHQDSRHVPLFAEMGPIYIFKEPIGPDMIRRLASRGPDSIPSFGNAAGLMWLSTDAHIASIEEESARLDADIAGYLHLLYHPSLLTGRHCPDASPSGPSGLLQRSAEVLGHIAVTTRMRPTDALWALAYGGPMSLLPFVVSKVDNDTLEPQKGNLKSCLATTALAAPVLRIISQAIQHLGNSNELCRTRGPEVLSKILTYLLKTLSSLDAAKHTVSDEEIVAAVVSLCQSQKNNVTLKMQLFSTLLLDLKIWSLCSYGIQKKLLSSLADVAATELSVMRDAKAIQALLDGCRRCYWTIHEKDSMNTFSIDGGPRPIGEVNALVDELMSLIEFLMGMAPPPMAVNDIRCLLGFLVDCPQPNQVARALHLIHRLVAQPNSRAETFAEAFVSCGGIETLLVLLQREAKAGDHDAPEYDDDNLSVSGYKSEGWPENYNSDDAVSLNGSEFSSYDPHNRNSVLSCMASSIGSRLSASESLFIKNLGGIRFSISAENARKNVYNIDKSDGIVVAIIGLFGALVGAGHLKFGSHAPSDLTGNLHGLLEGTGSMLDDKVSLVHFALQKTLQAAPNRLMTGNVYMSLLSASLKASARDEEVNFYDSQHRFEHLELLLVLLRSLPYSTKTFQTRALQDLLILACSHTENRSSLTNMEEWPEWLLEILISNHEMAETNGSTSSSIKDVEDLIHSFLIIMLEHSMREKDGWKDIEATIHCAEWLTMARGSTTRDKRARHEKLLSVFKRRLLGELLDFIARELRVQTQVIAAASAGVGSYGLPAEVSIAEVENAAQLSEALVDNAIVMLMLVEDHFRLQNRIFSSTRIQPGSISPLSAVLPVVMSPSKDSQGLPFEVLASMTDDKGEISASTMERLTAAAAAEPYDSVSCAFVSYGSCVADLAQGWKYRSRLWYGVGQPLNIDFGGGGSGWDSWKSCLEKDSNGNWVEIPLVKKCVSMLQALLLDEVDGLGTGGGSGTGFGGLTAVYHLLDSDQPFFCMLRMTLLSLREDDDGEDGENIGVDDVLSERLHGEHGSATSSLRSSPRALRPSSALLRSVLDPILHGPVSESKRQRVLVTSCVLYSEVWHAISQNRVPLRKQYLEAVVPPLVEVLQRWGPLLAKIYELSPPDGLNPLAVKDPALDPESTTLESAVALITPGWAAAFASPPAAMALAMIAAGAAGGETAAPAPIVNMHLKRDSSTLLERKSAKLHTFSSFQEPLGGASKKSAVPLKDKATARAAALAAARDLERNAKIGSGRGLSAVAMATSAQRRSKSDMERVMRWNVSEAMATAWMECLQSVDTQSVYGKDFNALSYKFVALLVGSLAFARNMQRSEVDRRARVNFIARLRTCTGRRVWRKLIHYLIETDNLFGLLSKNLCNPKRVFWKIDYMESGSRMHICLRRDFKGTDHSGAAAAIGHDPKQLERDKENSILALKSLSTEVTTEDEERNSVINMEINTDDMWLYEDIQTRASVTAEQQLQVPMDSTEPQVSNYQDLAQSPSAAAHANIPTEHCEIIIAELPASIVRPLKVRHGKFQITTRRINFLVDKSEKKVEDKVEDKDRSWLMASLHQIHSRRYLLRRSALELFMLDRSNFFFDFGNAEARMSAYRAIIHARPPRLNSIYLTTQRPDQLLKRAQLMERWSRWEISNFEYLMQLNTLAGRSYNDITQYPIFPWVLSDYKSSYLDLSNPSSYRDLSKPIGALNEDRLKSIHEKYSSFNDPVIPKYHYDSHYSTAATVLYYLMRVEPFTTLSVRLQGGKFDRMFSDIGATWNGVLEDTNDVKELVPEMFYLPEILTNENSIDFGDKLGDSVRLPPWAENPVDFMHKHQMALESEYVSAHLHEWIDLIFGYKQQGKDAISANNVFFYVTYEGAVDIDKIQDPVQRRAVEDQVAYFGQTPSRLLTVPHISKMPISKVLHMQTIFRNPQEVKEYHVPSADRCNLPASAIHATSNALVIVDTNAPSVKIALHKWHPNTPDGHGMPFVFQPGINNINSRGGGGFMRFFRGKSGSKSEGFTYPQAHAYAASGLNTSSLVSITYNNEVITGGHVDNSIRLVSPDGAKTLEIAKGHCAPVTCLSLSPDGKYLVSGSRDTTVLVWRIHRSPRFRSGSMTEPPIGTVTPTSVSATTAASCFIDKTHRRRIEGPIQVIRGHLGEIVDCCVNSDLGAVASCSYLSDVLVHSVSRGRLLRKLQGVKADMVRISKNGVVVLWNNSVHALTSYSLNGILIARAYIPKSCSISCMEISFDGWSLLVGLNPCSENDCELQLNNNNNEGEEIQRLDVQSPSVCLIDLHTLKVFHTMGVEEGQVITAVAMNKDNTNLVVSTSEKQLIIYTNPAVKFTRVVRRAGSKLIGLPRGRRRSKRSLASVSSDDD